MSRNAILAIVIVLIVIVAGWWLLQSQKGAATPSPEATTTQPVVNEAPSSPTESTGASAAQQTDKNLVSITANGFSPQTITIKAGDEVTWVNNDTAPHQVNSAPHPTHTAYPPLNTVGLIQPSEKKSLTFPDAGTYKYHDHLNTSLTGSVTVQ